VTRRRLWRAELALRFHGTGVRLISLSAGWQLLQPWFQPARENCVDWPFQLVPPFREPFAFVARIRGIDVWRQQRLDELREFISVLFQVAIPVFFACATDRPCAPCLRRLEPIALDELTGVFLPSGIDRAAGRGANRGVFDRGFGAGAEARAAPLVFGTYALLIPWS
jgi:hypothetical protein